MLAFAAKLAGLLVVFGALTSLAMASAHAQEPPGPSRFSPATPLPTTTPAPNLTLPFMRALDVARRPFEHLFQESRSDKFAAVGPVIDALVAAQPEARLGVAVRWSNGETMFMRNAREPFPLASVAKVYMLVAYLDRLEREGRGPDEAEVDMLSSMIDVSDNGSAEEIWNALGGIDGMQQYLSRIGMEPLDQPMPASGGGGEDDPEAWGDAGQSASQMSLLLARLWQRELLDSEYTDLAAWFLGGVIEEQSWGVPTEVAGLDPLANVLFKNGWYPTDDGRWRINSVGIVIPGQGQPYVLVILGEGFESWSQGIETVNAVAAMINRLLLD